MISEALKRMMIARTTLLLDQPFFGTLAMQLQLTEDESCKTAWVDGVTLGYNPAFVLGLSNDECMTLVAHEVMHCACGHPWRRGGREHEKWNVACDYAINDVLIDAGFQLPANGLHDKQWAGRWSEWIYDRLPPTSSSGSGSGSGSGSAAAGPLGELRDAPNDASAPTEADWQANVKQATAAARGHMPQTLQENINAATATRVDWRSLLRKFVNEIARADYAWQRPNVRYLPLGIYLPSLYSHAMGRLAVALDTSGSVDIVLLKQFAAEISAIADELQPSHVDVIYCDAKVHRVDTFAAGETITMHVVGRGGTDFRPVFTSIEKSGDTPLCLIYFTDMDGVFPSAAPEYPVIWASYGTRQQAPFGDVVPCE